MNINSDTLKELIKLNFCSAFTYHDNTMTLLLDEQKIELLDDTRVDDSGDYKMERKLEVIHISTAYQSYFLFLDDKSEIKYLFQKGTQFVTEFFDNGQKPSNFEKTKTFLESFLLDRDIDLSDEAVCYISPYVEIIEPSIDYKKMLLDILNEYIKEEKPSTDMPKLYIDKEGNSKSESDSEFYELSKDNKIILSTSLSNKSTIFFIMKLFQVIYDKKLYLLNNFECFHKYLSKHKIKLDLSNLEKSAVLTHLDNIIFSDYIIESLIVPEPAETKSKKKQKIFTLKDIKKLIK
jgi:hypothetical protein